ncbi:MAG: hypothetical protein Q7T16_06150 [Candidatus Burarchaeum sp.]|nr:hypothetical protein [Candidatus Burarchaeum sp.]MDO8340210.1 hypothetical protein [Candidatus Burarchaeum sp.]
MEFQKKQPPERKPSAGRDRMTPACRNAKLEPDRLGSEAWSGKGALNKPAQALNHGTKPVLEQKDEELEKIDSKMWRIHRNFWKETGEKTVQMAVTGTVLAFVSSKIGPIFWPDQPPISAMHIVVMASSIGAIVSSAVDMHKFGTLRGKRLEKLVQMHGETDEIKKEQESFRQDIGVFLHVHVLGNIVLLNMVASGAHSLVLAGFEILAAVLVCTGTFLNMRRSEILRAKIKEWAQSQRGQKESDERADGGSDV